MLRRFGMMAVLMVMVAATQPALAQSSAAPASPPASAPSAALTARFSTFLTSLLAGQVPATGLSDKMRAALTPQVVAQIQSAFAPLGTLQSLQFLRQDSVQGYPRYHYKAVFAKGSQPLFFVLDSDGNIAGFFKDL